MIGEERATNVQYADGNDSSLEASATTRARGGVRRRQITFYDMKHSNNAARIRLWLRINGDALSKSISDLMIETVMLTHDDIESDEYENINPLKKVPALIVALENDDSYSNSNSNGNNNLHLFEAAVIMEYLEDVFPASILKRTDDNSTPEHRALISLMVRCHDLYISSPNCTQPNFSHTQGCMYLDPTPTMFTPARRTMNTQTRAAKLAELYKQLCWLEDVALCTPYLGGTKLTHADLTWFPTAVFMELLLPKVFGWTPIFSAAAAADDNDDIEICSSFPKLGTWFRNCLENPHFVQTRWEIRGTLLEQSERGRFIGVKEDVEAHMEEFKWKYV